MSGHRTAATAALAREAGVQRSYTDVRGRRRRASDAALAAVLTALGHEVGPDGAGAVEALRALRAGRDRQLAEPVTVAWGGSASIPLRAPGTAEWALALEDGDELRGTAPPGAPLRLARMPPGYHTLHLSVAGSEATVLVVSAPRRAYVAAGRSWGVFLPLYALSLIHI